MADESSYWSCFRPMRFRVSWRKWQYLPRHPAYKYEYFDGHAQVTPRPKPVDMLLDLASVPHLTWLYVSRLRARHGIGTFLLDRVVGALRSLSRSHLASTTSLGSDASLLWHWKNGFTLLDRGFSVRVGVEDATG